MRRALALLLAAGLAGLALLARPGSRPERAAPEIAGPTRAALDRSPAQGGLVPGEPEAPPPGSGATRDAFVLASDPSTADPVTPPSAVPATVLGTLRVDGELQERGRVELRSADGSWSSAQALNYAGRFRFDEAPSGDLALAFELPAGARQLLVASLDVAAAPGAVVELALELESTEVNVRVLGAGPGWNEARVEVAGPGLAGSVETDESGRCALGLVVKGTCTFDALTRSGRRGSATAELAGGEGLETVVIATQESPGR